MQEIVQKYYGETLTGTHDLQTNACCTDASLPNFDKELGRKRPSFRRAVVAQTSLPFHPSL